MTTYSLGWTPTSCTLPGVASPSASCGSVWTRQVPKDNGSSFTVDSRKNAWLLNFLQGPPPNYGLDDPAFAGHNGEYRPAS